MRNRFNSWLKKLSTYTVDVSDVRIINISLVDGNFVLTGKNSEDSSFEMCLSKDTALSLADAIYKLTGRKEA